MAPLVCLVGELRWGKLFNCCSLFPLSLCEREEVSTGVKENVYPGVYVQLCLYSLWAHEAGKHTCALFL